MHVLGTWVPTCLGVARSASSAKAAQALGCSLTPGLRVTFGRVTCMARTASVPGLWTLGFLPSCGARAWFWGSPSPGSSCFGFRVWYVSGFGFPPVRFRPRPGLAGVCWWMRAAPGLRLLGMGSACVCLGAGCGPGAGYEGRGVAPSPTLSAGGCGVCPGVGWDVAPPLLGLVRGWCAWIGVSFVPRRSCPGRVAGGPVWVFLDARPWGFVSPAGVCSCLVWGGRSLTGPGGLSRPVWRSFFDLGGCPSLPLTGGGAVCGGGLCGGRRGRRFPPPCSFFFPAFPTERMPPRMAQPWGQESLDCEQSEGDAQRPSAEADSAAALDLDLWLPWTSDGEQLTLQVRTRWIFMDIHHIMNGTRTMADVILDHCEGRQSPPPTMEHPSRWRYVATHLMVHMGAYNPDDLDRLHWRWHHRATLRLREALLRQNIWTIRTSRPRGPAAPGRDTGHPGQRSPTTQGPPRQMARTTHSQSPHG